MHTLQQIMPDLGCGLSAGAAVLAAAELLTLVTVPSVLLSRRGQPLAALSWTLALVAVPLLGVLVWWLFGRRFRDLLVERARSGLRVRLLLDAMGSFRTGSSFLRPIEEAGGEVAFFAPMKFFRRSLSFNFRNHRKILVADGHTAYTGGLNIGDTYLRDWRDAGLLLEGPVASQLQEVFLDDWFFAGNTCRQSCTARPGSSTTISARRAVPGTGRVRRHLPAQNFGGVLSAPGHGRQGRNM